MKPAARTASRLPWLSLVLTAGLIVFGLVLVVLTPRSSGRLDDAVASIIFVGVAAAYGTVGRLLASRRPENPIGWLFCAGGVLFGINFLAAEYSSYALLGRPGSLPAGETFAWLLDWTLAPAVFLPTTFLFLVFPNGRLLSRRWRPAAWLSAIGIVLITASAALDPGLLEERRSVTNPYGIEGAEDVLDALGAAGFLLIFVGVLAAVASLIVRLRRARGQAREQIKWVTSAFVLLGGLFIGGNVGYESEVGNTLALLGFSGIPVAAGIAIFKYRLYDIDLIIRRTLVYGVLSAGLAGTYFGIVLALQQAFSSFTEGNELAIAGSTLAVAALFRPARRRIQAIVDRRFYRKKYDAQKTLEAFSARLREEIDLEALGGELRTVVQETMQPPHVSLWLRRPEG